MLQLGEEAENRLSTEKHKVLRLLGIRLRPALPSLPPPTPPPHKDIIGKGTLASVLLTKTPGAVFWRKEVERNHTQHASYSVLLGSDTSNIRSEFSGNPDCALSIALALTTK